jgi:hypothetical protein
MTGLTARQWMPAQLVPWRKTGTLLPHRLMYKLGRPEEQLNPEYPIPLERRAEIDSMDIRKFWEKKKKKTRPDDLPV